MKSRVRGHLRLLKVVPFDRLCYGFILLSYSKFVRKMNRFEIFDLKNAVTLKTVKVIENVAIR